MQGKIIKAIAGFYYVEYRENIYSCKAKGIFRNQKRKPLVGENVVFEMISEKEGNIIELLPRYNSMLRPAVANIDQALVVLSLTKPSPPFYMLDKYLISMHMQEIPLAICWNKLDLEDFFSSDILSLSKIYQRAGYPSFWISANTGEGMEDLKQHLYGKTTVLAGPSGVGKSTLTNSICPNAKMQTQDISQKIERGKHTTRHSELFVLQQNSYICDTPGFTSISIERLEKERLRYYYPEFIEYEGKCRFTGCVHRAEPDCAIKSAIHSGKISKLRYENYLKLYQELEDIRRYG